MPPRNAFLQANLPMICRAWLGIALVLSLARGVMAAGRASPFHVLLLLAVLALPVLALQLALRQFREDRILAQPAFRFARLGRWQRIDPLDGHGFENFGAGGLLLWLLGGLLLNIPVRALEFAAAMPTPILHAPAWYLHLYSLMLLDLGLLASCYAGLVGLAIRRVPLFPRLLAATWLLDIVMQIAIGATMARVPGLPHVVSSQLAMLLHGNIEKVGISMAIWMPYLLLSRRINLTYRMRVRATH